jgi:serine/threonine-protein kinase
VKPGNVLVDQNGLVKVADFGIARAITATSDDHLTQVGTVMGTATYFSPEQARGDAVDPRSDIYSLGCVLYELVVGRPPFSGDSPVAIAYKQVHESPVPPRQLNPSVPVALEAIILKCLAKNPANRYPSAEDLRADLRRFREGNRILAEPVMAPPAARAPAATGVLAATTAIAPTRAGGRPPTERYAEDDYDDGPRRSSGAFFAVLVILLLLLGGMLFLLARTLGVGGDGDGATLVEVPRVINELEADARQTLESFKFEVTVTEEANDDVEAGRVFAQDPESGAKIEEGATVELKVSAGSEAASVPGVVGRSLDEARDILTTAGFTVRVEPSPDEDAPVDQVTEQDPAPQEEAPKGSAVTLFVGSAPEGIEVRDVTGRTEGDAEGLLQGDGFKTSSTTEPSSTVAKGRVIRTEPGAGGTRPEGSTITLVVSSGPEVSDVTVPNVVGLSEDAATSVLEGKGLVVEVDEFPALDESQEGKVISQSPTAGNTVETGDTVTITVSRVSGD